ncbi:PAS domain S-box protein [Sphaerospermopsis aphanizomenoides BCCUSP55]|uniref:PAS domain S-box protein n=1 Tax=Sphaerospermopsis aphanizomenoides TaxID=459663 RepID=UPI0019069E5A|nr:PAS domain S-box protein [Sphaerospermopsis aphanizomenoides]MBK1990137.1 PAS domain S-box protein [Sphaerospermopsis aphanizomenoides BCCUSP55]
MTIELIKKLYLKSLPYLVAIGSTIAALLLSLWLKPLIFQTIGIFFCIALIVTSWYGGFRAGLVSIVLIILSIIFFLSPPQSQYVIYISPRDHLLRLGLFVTVAFIINWLTSNLTNSQKKIRKLHQQIAQANAEQLRMALAAAQMGIWDWNLVTGKIIWSPEHEQLFGFAPGSFDGKHETFAACVHPEDISLVNQAVQQALATHSAFHCEFRVVWPDGSIHWMEGRGRGIYNSVGEPVHMTGTAMAIDDRKQTQGLLQQQLEQQALVMKMTQQIRQSLNLEDILQTTVEEVRQFLGCDRVIVFKFDPGWGGTTVVESVASEWMAIFPLQIYDPCIGEENIARFKQGFVTAKADIYDAGINPCHIEFLASLQVRANLVVPILLNDELWGLLAAHHCTASREWQSSEITLLQQVGEQVSIAIQQAVLVVQLQTELRERQQAEVSLRVSQSQLERQLAEIENIYQSAPVGLGVLDTNLKFVHINQRLAEINGFSIESHIGRTIRDLLPDLADPIEGHLLSVLSTGNPLLNLEMSGENPAQPGVQRTCVTSYLPLKAGSHIIGISALCEEITERKQAEQSLQERKAILRLFAKYAPAGIAMFDKDMRYVMASQRWVDDYNLDSVESLIGRSHYEIFPEIPARWRQIHQRCLTGTSEKCDEDLFVRADGRDQWLCWEVHPWYTATGEIGGLIFFAENITQRKQTQLALQQLNAELEQRVAQRTEELKKTNDLLLETLFQQQQNQRILAEQVQLLDLAHDSIITRELNGVITFWNQGAEKMYGWTKAEALGQISHTLLQTQFPQPLTEIADQLLATGYWEGELTHFRHDAQSITVASRWVLQTDNIGQPIKILEINNDITLKKQTQAALQRYVHEIEDLYNFHSVITRNMAEGICLVKADNGVIVYANPKFEQMFGYKPCEINGQHVSILNYADDTVTAKDVHLNIKSAILEQGEVTYEVHNVKKDGTEFWCSATASVFHHPDYGDVFVAVQQDITERKRIADALRESEEKFRQLAENIQAVFWMADAKNEKVLYVSPAYESLWQRSCESLYQNPRSWLDPIHPEDRQRVQMEIIEQTITGRYNKKYRIIRPDGSIRWISDRAFPIKNETGEIIRLAGLAEDITEQQKIAEMKNEFISIVSHELRTPLTAIQAALDLLNSGIYDQKPHRFKRMIEIASIDCDRLVRLVNEILDIERLESGKFILEKTTCQIHELIQQAVMLVEPLAQKQSINVNIYPIEAQVWVDADGIIQTLTNLLGNAIKFSPLNSTITIRVEQQPDFVLVQVTDQGMGIPTGKLETIFEKFQQVDASDSRSKGGTGLGLAICRSIITQHGGRIWAESTLGLGSTFLFTLPIC